MLKHFFVIYILIFYVFSEFIDTVINIYQPLVLFSIFFYFKILEKETQGNPNGLPCVLLKFILYAKF